LREGLDKHARLSSDLPVGQAFDSWPRFFEEIGASRCVNNTLLTMRGHSRRF